MSDAWIRCRSGATLGFDTWERTMSTCTMAWERDDDASRPTLLRSRKETNSATLALVVNESQFDDIDVPIVRVSRRTEWFRGAIAELPKRAPHISPSLLALALEDE